MLLAQPRFSQHPGTASGVNRVCPAPARMVQGRVDSHTGNSRDCIAAAPWQRDTDACAETWQVLDHQRPRVVLGHRLAPGEASIIGKPCDAVVRDQDLGFARPQDDVERNVLRLALLGVDEYLMQQLPHPDRIARCRVVAIVGNEGKSHRPGCHSAIIASISVLTGVPWHVLGTTPLRARRLHISVENRARTPRSVRSASLSGRGAKIARTASLAWSISAPSGSSCSLSGPFAGRVDARTSARAVASPSRCIARIVARARRTSVSFAGDQLLSNHFMSTDVSRSIASSRMSWIWNGSLLIWYIQLLFCCAQATRPSMASLLLWDVSRTQYPTPFTVSTVIGATASLARRRHILVCSTLLCMPRVLPQAATISSS